ncbi:MAG: hypothetical protein AAB288_03465, partial [Acidobacteriota bacterium]
GLGEGRAVPGEALPALAVRRQHGGVDGGPLALQPGEERRPEVEADAAVIVGELEYAPVLVQERAGRVGPEAGVEEALIAVSKRA